MDFITTTDLRTKTPLLIQTLSQGKSVKLIHRSKILGDISRAIESNPTPFDARTLEKASQAAAKKFSIPYDLEARDKIYRRAMMKKYGKYLS